jgi:ferritin-like metal-binding protein YciE
MDPSAQKIQQYLGEAHASEVALVRVLQAQIAMTPRGAYRSAVEDHLAETRDHATRVRRRLREVGSGANRTMVAIGLAETVVGQVVALSKTPLDLLRGTGGEEKVLKNAKDAAATEALEIATYTALERLARRVGDDRTAELAASIRADEERMLETILTEIPNLTDAVVDAEVDDAPSFDVAQTGAADAVRAAAGSVGSSGEPWAGYDGQTVAEVRSALARGDAEQATRVRAYERAHKNRIGVIRAAEAASTTAGAG